jgi:hypothetical protein
MLIFVHVLQTWRWKGQVSPKRWYLPYESTRRHRPEQHKRLDHSESSDPTKFKCVYILSCTVLCMSCYTCRHKRKLDQNLHCRSEIPNFVDIRWLVLDVKQIDVIIRSAGIGTATGQLGCRLGQQNGTGGHKTGRIKNINGEKHVAFPYAAMWPLGMGWGKAEGPPSVPHVTCSLFEFCAKRQDTRGKSCLVDRASYTPRWKSLQSFLQSPIDGHFI